MLNDVLTIWLLRNQMFLISHPVFPSQQSWDSAGHYTHAPFGLVGSNGLFGIWLLRNQVSSPFAPISLRSLVGSNGLGPSTSRLSGVCSNQLSYEPMLVEVIGFEPMTPCLQGRCSTSWAIPPYRFQRSPLYSPLHNKCLPLLKGKHPLRLLKIE